MAIPEMAIPISSRYLLGIGQVELFAGDVALSKAYLDEAKELAEIEELACPGCGNTGTVEEK